jgi:1,4-dihydroxy-2-naphthoate octaprenyltransferase
MTLAEAQRGAVETSLLLVVAVICLATVAITALICGYSEAMIIIIVGTLAGVAGFTGGALSVYSRARDVLKRKD